MHRKPRFGATLPPGPSQFCINERAVRFGSCSLARYVWSSPVTVAVAVPVPVTVAKRRFSRSAQSASPVRPEISSRAVPGFSSCSSECDDEKLVSFSVFVVIARGKSHKSASVRSLMCKPVSRLSHFPIFQSKFCLVFAQSQVGAAAAEMFARIR